MTPAQALGAPLVIAGLVLTLVPSLVGDSGPAPNTFAAIERRIPWGALAGLGALLVARTQLRPLNISFAWLVFWATSGVLVARLLGLALDGADSRAQWMWVGVEIVVVVASIAYARHKRADAF